MLCKGSEVTLTGKKGCCATFLTDKHRSLAGSIGIRICYLSV